VAVAAAGQIIIVEQPTDGIQIIGDGKTDVHCSGQLRWLNRKSTKQTTRHQRSGIAVVFRDRPPGLADDTPAGNRYDPLMVPPVLTAIFILACVLSGTAGAASVYKWVDENGIVHYTDRAPEDLSEVETLRFAVDPKPLARLALESADGSYRARARSLIHGSLEVELSYQRNDNIDSRPRLPTRHVLSSMNETVIAELFPADRTRQGQFTLNLNAVPGRPDATPEDIEYPLPVAGAWQLGQGFGGSFSHNDPQSRYAVDIGLAEGTPIVAVREGVVMQVESDFDRSGLDREKFADRANHIRIEHADGTMALYAHLQPGGTLVRPGQKVRAGQTIGYSGNTGFSTGPHLHFAIQINAGMRLESIPFRMAGPSGPLRLDGR
jgi:murein DD-endopeptidase MepM/ murein hydrolase activator NlpD